jgi:Uma2 family endonuclease
MTDPLVRPVGPWTVDDLPDDGYRYEIVDGSLLVPPSPAMPHIRVTTYASDKALLVPSDVILAAEVVSPGSGGDDQVVKRYRYGKAGIPHYWIVDQKHRTLTVLRHDGAEGHVEVAVVRPGETWQAEEPFPLKLDPADFV